jgi:ribosomal subunit interface protein
MNTNTSTAAPLASRAARRLKIATWEQEAMDILIRTEGVELTDELHEAVSRKIGRVRQYAPRALRARVRLHKVSPNRSAHQFRARVHYEIPGNDLFAEHSAHEPVAAIDLVAEKIERRLRRRKTARLARRVRDHRVQARRGRAITGIGFNQTEHNYV